MESFLLPNQTLAAPWALGPLLEDAAGTELKLAGLKFVSHTANSEARCSTFKMREEMRACVPGAGALLSACLLSVGR